MHFLAVVIKTTFNYCLNGGGQNSVTSVTCAMYQNKRFTHNMLHYQNAHKSIVLHD